MNWVIFALRALRMTLSSSSAQGQLRDGGINRPLWLCRFLCNQGCQPLRRHRVVQKVCNSPLLFHNHLCLINPNSSNSTLGARMPGSASACKWLLAIKRESERTHSKYDHGVFDERCVVLPGTMATAFPVWQSAVRTLRGMRTVSCWLLSCKRWSALCVDGLHEGF